MYHNNELRGEVMDPKEYYKVDKRRFERCLEDFKKGWNYYLSALECDLIETKIKRVLESQSFRYTR